MDAALTLQYPNETVMHVCEFLEIEYHADLLCWRDGRIREWSAEEAESQMKYHKTLEHSTGIIPPKPLQNIEIRSEHEDILKRAEEICNNMKLIH